MQPSVLRAIDLAHSAGANLRHDLIRAKPGARRKSQPEWRDRDACHAAVDQRGAGRDEERRDIVAQRGIAGAGAVEKRLALGGRTVPRGVEERFNAFPAIVHMNLDIRTPPRGWRCPERLLERAGEGSL